MTSTSDLLKAAQCGKDIDARAGVGEWQRSDHTFVPSDHPDGNVLVGRSLRMAIGTYERIKTAAHARGLSWSALVREWIDQGLQAADSGAAPDPIIELHRSIDAANRALQALQHHPAA